jgi:uncharacterized protein (DUF58 family)
MDPSHRQALRDGERIGARHALAVPETAMAGANGQQLGRRAGTSLDFQDYREYQPGDDLRTIDWNVYGRTDRLTVKLFREEVNPHLDIVLDCSRSMDLPETPKASAALTLAAMLGTAADNARCSKAVWLGADGFRRAMNDALPAAAWDGIDFMSPRSLTESFSILPPRLRRTGIRVLISDLFWLEDPMITLRRLGEAAASAFVIQLVARADVTAPELGNIRLVDSESGRSMEMFIDSTVEQRYRDAFRDGDRGRAGVADDPIGRVRVVVSQLKPCCRS